MLALLRLHLWRKQSMAHCWLAAFVSLTHLSVWSFCMHACIQESLHNFGCMPLCLITEVGVFGPLLRHTQAHHTQSTFLHPVSICMHYVLGIASVSLCWSRQSWASPTDNHEEEETEELGQQCQQQRGHHHGEETQPRHQLQPLQSGTCKHQLHLVCLLSSFFFYDLTCLFTHKHHIFLMVLQSLCLIYFL